MSLVAGIGCRVDAVKGKTGGVSSASTLLCSVSLLAFLILPVCALPACANGVPDGVQATSPLSLSLPEALQRAQTHSQTVRQADARLAQAEARVRNAGALASPLLTLAQPIGQNTGGTDEDILISQAFELGDKRRQRMREASAEREAARAERAGALVDLVYATQSAYYEAQRAEEERQLAADTLANAVSFAKTAEIQFQAGDVARSNVVRSQIEQARAQQALTQAETEKANRLAALRSLLGITDATEIRLTDSPAYMPVTYTLPALDALALRNRADLRAARQMRAAREAALHGIRAATQPDLLLEGRHSTLDPTIGGNTVRIGVTFPLFDLGRNRTEAQAAQGALREQEATVQETERLALLEVENAFRTLQQARKAVDAFPEERLMRAKDLLEMAQTGYTRRATTYLELLDAQQVYRSEQADYARALAAYRLALAALQRAVGGTLP